MCFRLRPRGVACRGRSRGRRTGSSRTGASGSFRSRRRLSRSSRCPWCPQPSLRSYTGADLGRSGATIGGSGRQHVRAHRQNGEVNPDCRRDARRVCGARGKRSAGSTRGFARTWTRRGIRRSRFPRDGSALHRERAKDHGVRARKGQTRSRRSSRRSRRNSRRGGAPDRSLRAWSGTYRVTLARICLVPSMITEKQPTNAGETTRASLNARQNPRAEPEIERVELFLKLHCRQLQKNIDA